MFFGAAYELIESTAKEDGYGCDRNRLTNPQSSVDLQNICIPMPSSIAKSFE